MQRFCHQLGVPTFSSASTSVRDSQLFPECLSTAPREWAWTCWFHSEVGVHRHTSSLKVWSFSCRGKRMYNRSPGPLLKHNVLWQRCSLVCRGCRGSTEQPLSSSSSAKDFYPRVHAERRCERAAFTRRFCSAILRNWQRNLTSIVDGWSD